MRPNERILRLPSRGDARTRAASLSIGYKIALEIFVKGDFCEASEVPIHFADRQHGESKLSLKEQLNFLRHLGRLYAYKLRFGAGT